MDFANGVLLPYTKTIYFFNLYETYRVTFSDKTDFVNGIKYIFKLSLGPEEMVVVIIFFCNSYTYMCRYMRLLTRCWCWNINECQIDSLMTRCSFEIRNNSDQISLCAILVFNYRSYRKKNVFISKTSKTLLIRMIITLIL